MLQIYYTATNIDFAKVGCNTYERVLEREKVKGNFCRNWAYYNSKFVLKKLVNDLLSLLTYGRRFVTLLIKKVYH